MLLAPKGDPDALDIPTPRSYAEAIEGPYSSQWQAAMDAEMASWKSTGTYVDEVPPPGANIVSGMWIFRVKRPPSSPPVFKARYVARGFSQRQGVDFFQTFSPTPKMTTLRVLLHVAAQRDYELHSLDFSTTFLQGSLHEEIWLRHPPGFTGSFPADDLVFATADTEALAHVKSELQKRHTCTDLGELTSYLGLRITRDRAQRTITLTQSHMVQQVLQHFGFTYSSPQSTPLPTGHSLSAPPSDESVEPSGPYPELVGCLMYLMTCTRPDLAYPLSLLARYVAPGRHRKVHWDVAKRVLRYLCSISSMGLVLGGRARVVLTGHADASWVDDLATQRSSQGYTFSLGSGSVSWRSTRSSSVLSSSCEAGIYTGAMAAQELRWLTYLLIDLGEAPRSPPVLYVDNKAMLALCQEHRLEHRTKHIALRYFLTRELQQRGQLRLAYVASQANTADVFTKALQPSFYRAQGIRQTFTLPASPQQNGIAERRIGMVMDVARTSMIHAAAPHFLWPFAVQYAAHQLNLQPRVSLPETSPTLLWTGKVGDAFAFRVWGSRAFVRDLSANKLSPRATPCVFLGFPPDAPGWQFYHPTSRRVLSSQDVTFDESVPYYRLFPYRTAPLPPPPLFLAPGPPPVDPLPPQGPAPSGVSQVDAVEPVEVAVDSGAATGDEPAGAGSGGTGSGGAVRGGAESGGAEPGSAGSGGVEPGGAEPGSAEPGGAEPGGTGRSTGAAGTGGAAAAAGVGPAGATGVAGGVGAGVVPASGAGAAGPTGVGAARASRAPGAGAAGGVSVGVSSDAGPSAGKGVGAVGAGGAAGAGAAPGVTGAVPGGSGDPARPRPYFVPLLEQVLGLPPSPSPAPPLECPQPVQSQSLFQPVSPLHAPSPYTGPTGGLAERHEPASRPASPIRAACTSGRAPRQRPPAVPRTHLMALRPSTVSQRVPLPSPPASSLPILADPESDSLRAAIPTVARLLSTVVPDPSFASTAASALVAELVDFAARCHLDYAARLVAESASVYPPSVGGECALSTHVLEDRQEEFQCFAAALPHLVSMLIAPEGDPDAPDIPNPRSYAEAIEGLYSSQWQSAMDAEMASWKSTGTYVDEVPPPGANIVSGMWIFRVKRPPGSPPVFNACYVARGFSQRQGVDYFQTFSPTPKMTTLWVLLQVAAQRDYELHSLDFSTAFLQGSLHEEIWLRRPPGFTGSFPPGTQWSLRRPVYGLRQAPREWHDTLRTTLAALGFAPSTADPSLFLRTDTSLPPFYILVYVDDLVFAIADTAGLAHVKSELQKRHTCTDLGELRSYLGLQITRDRAQRTITLTQSHLVQQVLQRFGFTYSSPQATPLSTRHSLSALPSDESVEPSGPYPELVGCLMYLMTCTRPDLAYPLSILARYVAPGRHRPEHMAAAKRVLRYLCSTLGLGLVLGGRRPVVLTGHADASWADDQATQRSSQGYTFSLGSGSVSWRSTRLSSVLGSCCEAEIYAGAMAAQELRWLTYLLTDLGEPPRSPPVLYVDNKAMLALCQEHRLEHRTKHIALRYFLARELQQRGQLRLAYVASQANAADVFTKALLLGDHQRFCMMLGLVPTWPHLLTS
ncbi:unnamed protein product [Closterium sp. NIES-54]